MAATLLHIDAFTRVPFAGNPAAVCLFPQGRDEAWMQDVAAEMNLSETAYLEKREQPGHFGLRWFTPAAEVPLCGHATLASAHAVWQEGIAARDQELTFHTKSGPLRARSSDGGITMDFPAIPTAACDAPDDIDGILGAHVVHFEASATKYLAELASEEAVRSASPDFARLAKLPREGVVVTARSSDPRFDFVSRFFAPKLNVPEDPVTGSSHCLLATYWATRLGRQQFEAKQVSRRGGEMRVELRGDRVFLTGYAVTVFRTELAV